VQHRFLDTLTALSSWLSDLSFDEIRDEDSLAILPGCAYRDFSDAFAICGAWVTRP